MVILMCCLLIKLTDSMLHLFSSSLNKYLVQGFSWSTIKIHDATKKDHVLDNYHCHATWVITLPPRDSLTIPPYPLAHQVSIILHTSIIINSLQDPWQWWQWLWPLRGPQGWCQQNPQILHRHCCPPAPPLLPPPLDAQWTVAPLARSLATAVGKSCASAALVTLPPALPSLPPLLNTWHVLPLLKIKR